MMGGISETFMIYHAFCVFVGSCPPKVCRRRSGLSACSPLVCVVFGMRHSLRRATASSDGYRNPAAGTVWSLIRPVRFSKPDRVFTLSLSATTTDAIPTGLMGFVGMPHFYGDVTATRLMEMKGCRVAIEMESL